MSFNSSKLFGLLAAVAAAITGAAGQAQGASRTWDAGGADSNWSTALNWSGDVVPTIADTVTFGDLGTESEESVTIDTDVSVAGMTFNSGFNGGSGVTVTAGQSIFVRGNVAINEPTLEFQSGPAQWTVTGTFTAVAGVSRIPSGLTRLIAGPGYDSGSPTPTRTHPLAGNAFYNLIVSDPTGPSPGPIAYWKLDETSNTTAADGGSGTAANLSVSGTTSPSVDNQGADLLFVNARGRIFNAGAYFHSSPAAAKLQPTGSWTVTAWVWPGGYDTDGGGSEVVSSRDCIVLRIMNTGKVRVIMKRAISPNTWTTCESDALMGTSTWNFIGGVHDDTANTLTVYVNGTAKSCASGGNQAYQNDGTQDTFRLGKHPSNSSYDFASTMDDVRMYDRALTYDEMAQLAAGGGGSGSATHTLSQVTTVDGYLTVESGTLTLSQRLVVGGLLTINGTLTASNTYPLYAGSITKGGSGVFTTNSGTVVLTNAGTVTPGVTSFHNLRLEQTTETDLAGYWKFDVADGTLAADWSGNGRHATLVDTPTIDSSVTTKIKVLNPGAMSLNGTSEYASIPISGMPAVDDPHAVSIWVYWAAVPGAATTFVENWNVTSDTGYKIGWMSDGSLKVYVDTGSGANILSPAPANPGDGQWHHFVYSYNPADGTSKHRLYIDGSQTNGSNAAVSANATQNITVGRSMDAGGAEYFAGKIDDLRIYSTYLTEAQVKALYAGGQSGKGGTGNHTLAGVTVAGTLNVDNGKATIGAGNTTVTGNTTVNEGATMEFTTATSSLVVGNGSTVTMNGTLKSSAGSANRPSITSAGTYTFNVSTAPGRTTVLDLDGFAVTNTGNSGMHINNDGGAKTASTTFTNFKNISFSSTASGSPSYLLQIKAGTLDLWADGMSFDTTNTTKNVRLEDWDGSSASLVKMTIAGTCLGDTDCEDNDSDGDNGTGTTPPYKNNNVVDAGEETTNPALIYWLKRYHTESAGSIVGHPVAAFNWSTFAFRTNYVAMNIAGNPGADTLYARDLDGDKSYTWTLPSADDFVGAPIWTSEADGNYVYVIDTKGRVYKVKDTGAAFTQTGVWGATPYQNTDGGALATAQSPLMVKSSFLYWFGKNGAGNTRMFKLGFDKTASTPYGLGGDTRVFNTSPAVVYDTSKDYVFAATTNATGNSYIYRIPTDLGVSTSPSVSGYSVYSQIVVLSNKVFMVDDRGKLFVRSSADVSSDSWTPFADTSTVRHSPACSDTVMAPHANCAVKNLYVDPRTLNVFFGDKDGHVYCVNSSGVCSDFPIQPGSASDEFVTAPLYRWGVIVIGAKNGNLYFIDRSAATTFRRYALGAEVSSIAYTLDPQDSTTGAFMVATTDSRVFHFAQTATADPSGTP